MTVLSVLGRQAVMKQNLATIFRQPMRWGNAFVTFSLIDAFPKRNESTYNCGFIHVQTVSTAAEREANSWQINHRSRGWSRHCQFEACTMVILRFVDIFSSYCLKFTKLTLSPVRPAVFTVGFSGASLAGCAVWQYENMRSEAMKAKRWDWGRGDAR